MIDFTADINSKHSAADILLGENISNYIDELYKKHNIKIKTIIYRTGKRGWPMW